VLEEKTRQQIALFRYGLIADLVHRRERERGPQARDFLGPARRTKPKGRSRESARMRRGFARWDQGT